MKGIQSYAHFVNVNINVFHHHPLLSATVRADKSLYSKIPLSSPRTKGGIPRAVPPCYTSERSAVALGALSHYRPRRADEARQGIAVTGLTVPAYCGRFCPVRLANSQATFGGLACGRLSAGDRPSLPGTPRPKDAESRHHLGGGETWPRLLLLFSVFPYEYVITLCA
jgi:hypothetical protein